MGTKTGLILARGALTYRGSHKRDIQGFTIPLGRQIFFFSRKSKIKYLKNGFTI